MSGYQSLKFETYNKSSLYPTMWISGCRPYVKSQNVGFIFIINDACFYNANCLFKIIQWNKGRLIKGKNEI